MRYVAGGLNSKSQTHNNDFIDILNTYSMIISSVYRECILLMFCKNNKHTRNI